MSRLICTALAALLSFLLGCSGGNDSPDQSSPALAEVEYLADVRQISAAEQDKFVEQDGAVLLHTTATPFSTGDVIIWSGRAFKVTAVEPFDSQQFRYATRSPDFQEVFETLKIEADVAINPASASTSTRVRPQLVTSLPDFTIKPKIPIKGLSMTGGIVDTQGTVIFDYSAREGLRRAELSLRGSLTLNAAIGVEVSSTPIRREFTAGTPVNIPIPASLGTVAFKLPVAVFVELDSKFEAKVFDWNARYDFTAGARYDPATQKFVNMSSIQEAGNSGSVPDRNAIDQALQTIVSSLTLTQKTTVARVFVGPSIKPALSALNDSIGVFGLRNEVGLEAAVELQGLFPTLIDCARVPLALRNTVYAVLNYKVYESLLDFEGEEIEKSAKLFDERLVLPIALELGRCDAGEPYSSSYRTTDVELGTSIREQCDPQGNCSLEMFCDPGDVVGDVVTGPERWTLDALSASAMLVSGDRTYRGTFNPVTGEVLVNYTGTSEDVTPPGSTVRYFSTQSAMLTAAYDPILRTIRGNSAESVATSWSYDTRSVVCRSKFAYESNPIP